MCIKKNTYYVVVVIIGSYLKQPLSTNKKTKVRIVVI